MTRHPIAANWGSAAEQAVREAFRRRGYFVVPAYAIEDGGAPMLIGLVRKHVLPDMLVAKCATPRWIEVKFKDHCVQFRKTGFWRHGVDLPKWEAYREVERITGIKGSLVVLQFRLGPEADPDPHWLIQSFDHLFQVADYEPEPTSWAPKGMVYWNVDEMNDLGRIDFDPRDIPRLTRVIHVWEEKGKEGRTPGADLSIQQRELHYRRSADGRGP